MEIPQDFRASADGILDNPNAMLTEKDEEIRQLMKDQGILVPEELSEKDFLFERNQLARNNTSTSLSLTICPTINCNFRCTYCYQHHIPTIMSEEVQDTLLDWIEKKHPSAKNIHITWFGGEPLLGYPVIKRLTKKLQDKFGKENYSAFMITNGSLLKPDISKSLADLSISGIQVTLDGSSHIHNERRPINGGKPSFDLIVENLKSCDPRVRISLRVNIDELNAKTINPNLFDELDQAGLKGRLSVYFAPVVAYTDVCADSAGTCLSGKSWSSLEAQLLFKAYLRGYSQPSLPGSVSSFCIADNVNGWVINPNGLVFKCWNDVTHEEKAVMDIMSDTTSLRMDAELSRWESWNPSKLSGCNDCSTLPQCMSGCTHITLSKPVKGERGDCSELKYNLPEKLATYYLAEKQKEGFEKVRLILDKNS